MSTLQNMTKFWGLGNLQKWNDPHMVYFDFNKFLTLDPHSLQLFPERFLFNFM